MIIFQVFDKCLFFRIIRKTAKVAWKWFSICPRNFGISFKDYSRHFLWVLNSRFSKNLWRYHTKILRRKSISCRTDFLKLISLLTLLNAELPKCSKLSKSVWFFFSAWNLKFYANIYLGFTDSHKCAGLAAERVDPSSPGGSVLKTKMKQITKFEPK